MVTGWEDILSRSQEYALPGETRGMGAIPQRKPHTLTPSFHLEQSRNWPTPPVRTGNPVEVNSWSDTTVEEMGLFDRRIHNQNMSTATKIVLGTVGISALLAVILIAQATFA